MDAKAIIESLKCRLHERISYRDGKIATLANQSGGAYMGLAEISRHAELLTLELREALIDCHNELQAFGYTPQELPMPEAPDIDVQIEPKTVRIVTEGMLPYPIKGGAHFLHEKLDAALRRYARENALPSPLFNERCAVVFIHHYTGTSWRLRHIRDYDNVEHRCITNVIARYFMVDDSPACYISMDILAPGDTNQTEIRIMSISSFKAFVATDEIAYLP